MNEHISALENYPTAIKRITALWGSALFFEYIDNALLVNDERYEEPLTMDAAMELMFLSEIHKDQFEIIEREDVRMNLSDSLILDMRNIKERDPWHNENNLDSDVIVDPRFGNPFK